MAEIVTNAGKKRNPTIKSDDKFSLQTGSFLLLPRLFLFQSCNCVELFLQHVSSILDLSAA